jgi:hypothetical protein
MTTRTMKETGTECWEVYDDDSLVARIVRHATETGWMLVDLQGNALNTRSFETPKLAEKYLPRPASMTVEEFAGAVDNLITAARGGGLSDAAMIVVLEDAVERLE